MSQLAYRSVEPTGVVARIESDGEVANDFGQGLGHRGAFFRSAVAPALGLALALLSGCSNSELGATMSGTVLLDDQPVGPGVIIMQPASASETPPKGNIAADGSYKMYTGKTLGLKPGSYKVVVQAYEKSNVPEGQRSWDARQPIVPEKYLSGRTTDLELTVESGGNSIDVPLVSASN